MSKCYKTLDEKDLEWRNLDEKLYYMDKESYNKFINGVYYLPRKIDDIKCEDKIELNDKEMERLYQFTFKDNDNYNDLKADFSLYSDIQNEAEFIDSLTDDESDEDDITNSIDALNQDDNY